MTVGSRAELIKTARGMVDLYIKAEAAVLSGQAYVIAGQSLTRADLDKIRAGRREWEQKLANYQRAWGHSILNCTPVDD